jgi:outer membrane cobalamin receptor
LFVTPFDVWAQIHIVSEKCVGNQQAHSENGSFPHFFAGELPGATFPQDIRTAIGHVLYYVLFSTPLRIEMKIFFQILLALVICNLASAAEKPGRVIGCIMDESGGSLPGVKIEINGANLQKKITIYTEQTGCYSVSLPPGRYQIHFDLPGFTPETKNEVVVFSGRDAIVDRSLRISIKAEMIVSARKPLRDLVEESDNLIGVANAASQGAVRYEDLALRPVLRPGELLESVPGVITSQHSGQGKANQYYLRGFNLDHGTDLSINVDGMPVNFPTHGHGQGYSDLSFLIPELVNDVKYQKGPYYAERGDFASAGAVRIDYARTLDNSVAGVEAGSFEYGRGLFLSAPRLKTGNLLFALELGYSNGPWVHPDGYRKINGLVRYNIDKTQDSFSALFMGYDGRWDSTDQIPARAVESGTLDRFGAVDPTDGGDSSRYSFSVDWKHSWKDALTETSAYVLRYDLNLFSNFTYFLDDPVHGDQFEQTDRRTTLGGQVSHRWLSRWGNIDTENLTGVQFRNDYVGNVGLYHTEARHRLSTVRQDQVDQRNLSFYWQNTTNWLSHFRTLFGLRADFYDFDVTSNIPENSGDVSDSIVSPKLGLIFGPWKKTEFYTNFGYGFHSNDARGTTLHIDPVTRLPVDPVTPLVRSKGAEWGMRSTLFRNWQTTFTLWLLDFDSELLFIGDAGITEPSRASRRTGFEWDNRFKPLSWITVEWNWAYSRARFRAHDPAGNRIPGAVEGVFTAGLWLDGIPLKLNWFGHTVGVLPSKRSAQLANSFFGRMIVGLHLRYFGPRPLTEDNSVRSSSSTLTNLSVGYRISKNWNAFVDVFNLFDSKSSDIDYFYRSRLPGELLSGLEDVQTHPVEPISIRFSLTTNF